MSLFEISAEVRLIIKGVLIGIGVISLLWFFFLGGRAFYRALQPPKQTAPEVRFGKISPPIVANTNLSGVTVELDSPSGSLPSFPALVEVYPIPEPVGKVNSLDLASIKANQLGVTGSYKELSPAQYRWQDKELPAETVTINIVNNNFTYKYDWLVDPKAIAKTLTQPSEEQAIKIAKGFFSRGLEFGNDLENGSATTSYIKISGKNYTRVSSPSEANALEVNLFRQKVKDTYNIVGLNPDKALINALVAPESEQQILLGNFTHWLVDFGKGSTYPLRTSNEAFSDLASGKAYIASGKIKNLDHIKVVEMKLAYLETEQYSPYLQPVYIFTGDSFAGKQKTPFVAFLPAVSEAYLKP